MNKIITEAQLKAILDLAFQLRCPAPEWEGLKKLIKELPEADKKCKDCPNKK
jgi:hypothetical protein